MNDQATKKSIYDLPPLTDGGTQARQGMLVQDHIAVSFVIDMLKGKRDIQEVWCESQDDITLIRGSEQNVSVEFVQVKSGKLEHLWSVAEICKRDGVVGTSLLERSLANDRCSEPCTFRIVTLSDTRRELDVLKYEIESPKRTLPGSGLENLISVLEGRLPDVRSSNNRGVNEWASSAVWDVRHDQELVINKNLIELAEFLSWSLERKHHPSVQLLQTYIYPQLLQIVQEAAVASWADSFNSKRIVREHCKQWLVTLVKEEVAKIGSDKEHSTKKSQIAKRNKVSQARLPYIFFSYADIDSALAADVANRLTASHFQTWPTADRIFDTTERQSVARELIKGCSEMVVFVSSSSIISSAVHREVSWAAYDAKTVIRVMVEHPPQLPQNWMRFKHVDWDVTHPQQCIGSLINLLPATARDNLKHYLSRPENYKHIKDLLQSYPEWLPIENYMFSRYQFRNNVKAGNHIRRIDVIAARPNSGGIKCYVYYFASPIMNFGAEDNAQDAEFQDLLDSIHQHATMLIRPMSPLNPLHPCQIIDGQSGGMLKRYYDYRQSKGYGAYASLDIYVLAGQRQAGYDTQYAEARNLVAINWRERFFKENSMYFNACNVTIEIMSYTRIIEPAIN